MLPSLLQPERMRLRRLDKFAFEAASSHQSEQPIVVEGPKPERLEDRGFEEVEDQSVAEEHLERDESAELEVVLDGIELATADVADEEDSDAAVDVAATSAVVVDALVVEDVLVVDAIVAAVDDVAAAAVAAVDVEVGRLNDAYHHSMGHC